MILLAFAHQSRDRVSLKYLAINKTYQKTNESDFVANHYLLKVFNPKITYNIRIPNFRNLKSKSIWLFLIKIKVRSCSPGFAHLATGPN